MQDSALSSSPQNPRGKRSLNPKTAPAYLLALLLVNVALYGFLPQPLIAGIAVGVMCLLTFTGNLYLAYPVLLFYYTPLGLFLGISVFRIFTFLFLFSLLLERRRFIFKDQSFFFLEIIAGCRK